MSTSARAGAPSFLSVTGDQTDWPQFVEARARAIARAEAFRRDPERVVRESPPPPPPDAHSRRLAEWCVEWNEH